MRPALCVLTAVTALAIAAPADAGRLLERGNTAPTRPIAIFNRAHRSELGVITESTYGFYGYSDSQVSIRLWRLRPSGRRATPRHRSIKPPGVKPRGISLNGDVAVAYDSSRDRCLEVIATERGLVAQLLSGIGRRIGRPFAVGGSKPQSVALLYIPSKRRYLVAWVERASDRLFMQMRALGPRGRPVGSVRTPFRHTTYKTVALAYDPRRSGVVTTIGNAIYPGPVFARRLHTDGRRAGKAHVVAHDNPIPGLGYAPVADAFVGLQDGLDDVTTVVIAPDGSRRGRLHSFRRTEEYSYGYLEAGAVAGTRRAVLLTWSIEQEFSHQGTFYDDFARRLDATGRRPRGRVVPLAAPKSSDVSHADYGPPLAAPAGRGFLVAWPVRNELYDAESGDPAPYSTEWGVAVQSIR